MAVSIKNGFHPSWNTNLSAWGYLHIYYMHCRKTPIHSPSNRRPHWLSACLPCRSLVQLCINAKLEKNMHAECFTKSNRDAMSMCHWMSDAESYIILMTQGRVVRLWRAILLILLDLLALSTAVLEPHQWKEAATQTWWLLLCKSLRKSIEKLTHFTNPTCVGCKTALEPHWNQDLRVVLCKVRR